MKLLENTEAKIPVVYQVVGFEFSLSEKLLLTFAFASRYCVLVNRLFDIIN
jgi:hypothetical protein